MSVAATMRSLDNSRAEPARRRIPPRRILRASYDAAQTSSDNVRHWAATDSLSADAANSPAVRKKLRDRARYEVANNGWARSMVETLAHEVIGTGPRVQVLTGNKDANEWIERNFSAWCKKSHLARKFRTMRKAKAQDGEGLSLFVTNPRLGDVQLDLRTFETDQLATPEVFFQSNQVDGIDFDENGNPDRYHILKDHPGETSFGINPTEEITPVPTADEVIHIFRRDRPGQHRGIPEITPALPLFAKLRRYNLAVLTAAENIADISLALKTRQPDPDTGVIPSGDSDTEPDKYTVMDTFDLERGMVTVLPDDTDLFQPKSEQPSTTHVEYVKATLAEAFASVCMPYSVGAADSSDENFASGKLTRLGFKRAIQVERSLDWDPEFIRVFWAWFAEAKFAMPVQFRGEILEPSMWIVIVYWDGTEDIDPEKAARARAAELQTGQTSYPALFGAKGVDWETEQGKQAVALGLTVEDYRKRLADKLLGPAPAAVIPTPSQEGARDEAATE